MNRELVTGLAQLSAEKGLPKEIVADIVGKAIKRAYGPEENLDVKVDPQTGAMRIYVLKTAVEKVEDPKTQLTLAEAQSLRKDAVLGEIIPIEQSAQILGRIGAQAVKQVIQQSLREAEREHVFSEYAEREGDIINGEIIRFEMGTAIVDLGRAEGVLPRSEQAPHERYAIKQHRRFLVLEVRRTPKGPQIVLTRTHKNLVKRLFELEVPEIFHGQVEIMAIAREVGSRTKVAVRSRQAGIDPVGASVGQRGLRHQAVVNELGGEKIDIITWSADPAEYVKNALAPAQVIHVDIVPEEKTAYVVVPDKQLSLAIGKEGQNARLAAKLTSWRIDIRSESEAAAEAAAAEEPQAAEGAPAPAAAVAAPEPEDPEALMAQAMAESLAADEEADEEEALTSTKKRKAKR
ncbi:MAG TPA: transcription termination factor NusA [Candidatus Dormibacteraeota bacterium]|nr:transcription termination factor NusA [Candidatus Dormibacteraeota bacterium]